MAEKRYYWLKLKEGFFKEKAMKKLRKVAGGDTYTIIYLKMLLLSLQNNGRIYFDSIEDDFSEEIALEIDEEPDNVRFTILFLEKCGLLSYESEDTIYLDSIEEMIGSEAASTIRSRKSRGNKKALQCNEKMLQCNSDETNCNKNAPLEKEKEKEKEIDKENICASDNAQKQNKPSKKEINDLFEQLWKLYPCKKGKGQVSDSKKKKLYEIGYEEMERAITRYKDDLSKETWRKPQNGSTFFNTGYIDYLDGNYEQKWGDDSGTEDTRTNGSKYKKGYDPDEYY